MLKNTGVFQTESSGRLGQIVICVGHTRSAEEAVSTPTRWQTTGIANPATPKMVPILQTRLVRHCGRRAQLPIMTRAPNPHSDKKIKTINMKARLLRHHFFNARPAISFR